ncbi:MAG: molybdopterin molybdotransferase MoeA [Proteobacteria bacterium]|nr:molybdopterin molybdotransferase MoeA [Pseudomonadota bacterium]
MISVEEALKRILAPLEPLGVEAIPVEQAFGRTPAEDISAVRATPAFDTSAMDGYAVLAADLTKTPATLKIIGEAPAGTLFPGTVGKGQAARIFTGGIVPSGADTVVIQENTERKGDTVTILKAPATPVRGANIRKKGGDFAAGEVLLKSGTPLNERGIALAAAANRGQISVYKRPRVVLLAVGDELTTPGSKLEDGSVINTNSPSLAALVRTVGAAPITPATLPDNLEAITTAFKKAQEADFIITLGGASVGDYDYVRDAFKAAGGKLDFWKIAMKPGKPLMFGDLNGTPVIGLPGNPVSAYVTAFLFVLPALRKLQGRTGHAPLSLPARAGDVVPAAKDREVFYLGYLSFGEDAALTATPHPVQDSARMSTLNASDCLIHRPANAGPAQKGDVVRVYPLPRL